MTMIHKGEVKCLSRPVYCSQRQKLPAFNSSFPEIFYSYNVASLQITQNARMKERIRDNVEKCGATLQTFSKIPRGTFQFFCENICLSIQRSSLVIADITPIDGIISSNIIHEIGLAQGFRKSIFLITCEKDFSMLEKHLSNLKAFEQFIFPDDLDRLRDSIKYILTNSLPEINIINDAKEFQEFGLRLELKPFSRDFYSTLIPSMMRDSDLSLKTVRDRNIYPFGNDDPYIRQYIDIVNKRRYYFKNNLRNAKKRKTVFRDIYITTLLERYSKTGEMEGKKTPDPKSEVISRFKGIINTLIQHNLHYRVGLLDNIEPPYKFLIKHDCGVIIDNPTRRSSKNTIGIFCTIKSFVDENASLFHKLWNMPNILKDNSRVLNILNQFLNNAIKSKMS